jgi:hypothetical protein
MSAKTANPILALLLAAATPFVYASPAIQHTNQYLKSNPGLCFTENKGQWDERVLFKADGVGGLTWFIERDGFTVVYSQQIKQIEQMEEADTPWRADFQSALNRPHLEALSRLNERTKSPPSRSAHALKFRFVTPASSRQHQAAWEAALLPDRPAVAAEVIPSGRLSHNNNYFLGNDRSKWAPNCGNFTGLTCRDVWEGIDMNWYEKNGLVEFDFVVNPGADPNQIQMRVDGLEDALELTAEGGEIILPTSLGEVKMAMPEAWMANADGNADAEKNRIAAKFVPIGENRLGVRTPEGYDAKKKLIVDPLIYSTYLGGGGNDYAYAITSDGEGGVVVAGQTGSDGFPTTEGAYDRSFNGDADAFIARLSGYGS